MKPYLQLLKYIFADTLATVIAWNIFMYAGRFDIIFVNSSWVTLVVTLLWLFIHWLSGYYNRPYFKSRLSELLQTVMFSFLGSLIIYLTLEWGQFLVVPDYHVFMCLFLLHVGITYALRLAITSVAGLRIRRGELNANAIVVGTGRRARRLIDDMDRLPKSTGVRIAGCVPFDASERCSVPENMLLERKGTLREICVANDASEVIVAVDNLTEEQLYGVFDEIRDNHIRIKLVPTNRDVLAGGVALSTIYGVPLIDLSGCRMSECEQNIKRLLDVVLSILALIVTSPVMLWFAIRIGRPVIYKQERIGLHGKPFYIYKLRSMVVDSELSGPQLSSDSDERVTKVGRFMRKYRIDELPQFYNVIKGDMSIVGPRPERLFYIEQIAKRVPYYFLINNVRPGITSWGMVKYGYASTVDEMVERAPYDFIYLDNMSILIDCKIAIYTIRTILLGKGL